MSRPDPTDPDRPVLPWRLVAGALLHVAVPAYLVVLAAAWLAIGVPVAPLGFVGRVSALFLAGFALVVFVASGVAALLDPPLRRRRARREDADPAMPARRATAQLASALRRADAIGGAALTAAVAWLRAVRWDLGDAHDRAIVADLARAVDAFAAAHASAASDRREDVAGHAADALTRVAIAAEDLAIERARLDEGDALTHARYLANRYPSSTLDPAGPDRD
ncbi:MAG: hypothetical protein ACRYFW_08890 [Janthinobacterium lividum]